MPAQFVDFKLGSMSSLAVGKLANHKRGVHRHEHTAEGPRAGTAPVHLVDEVEGTRLALEAIDADRRERAGKRGRPPSGVYDVLFSGPARYDGSNGKPLSRRKERKWADACVEWVREHAPQAVIANAVLHRDEASPHVHLTLIPLEGAAVEGGALALDWKAVRARLAGGEPRAKLKVKGLDKAERNRLHAADRKAMKNDMVLLQDSFHAEVSAKYGIEREAGGAGRRGQGVDRRIAAELEAAAATKRAEEARAAAERDTKAAQVAQERRVEEEAALAKAETERREKARAATLMAEDERRAELELQTAADRRLERVEAKIQEAAAVGSAGRVGRQAKRGQAIREAHLEVLVRVRGQRDQATAGRKTERERADTECERADAAEKDVRRLTGELNRAIESMQRISEYVIGKMREHVERSYARVAGVGIVHQAMADTLEWSREKFAPGWEPEAVVQTRERERQAAAHDAPAVHQGRDQGSGL